MTIALNFIKMPNMVPMDRLSRIVERFERVEAQLSDGDGDVASLGREHSELRPVVGKIEAYRGLLDEIAETEAMLGDSEMRALAEDELPRLKNRLPELERELRAALLPADAADARPAIVEIRPGTGGDEAALFAGDLLRMYQRYSEAKGWRFYILEESHSGLGGIKEAVASVKGEGAFARLKFESGTHRVQRVPETESGGRIHTSAATVAVLPEAREIDVRIGQDDLRIDTMRSGGAGGQHVNTTDSAVRITHLPTGIVVVSSEKSQHQNRSIAMQVLRARIYELERVRADAARASERKSQVGSGDRSERVRTYNFKEKRITDHRIGLTLYKLDQVMQGELDEVIDALTAHEQTARLAELEPES